MSRRKRPLRSEALEAKQLLTSLLGDAPAAPPAWETTAWVADENSSSQDLLAYLDAQLRDVMAEHDTAAVAVPWTTEFCRQIDGFMAQVATWEHPNAAASSESGDAHE